MKIQILLIGLILLSGCNDGVCRIFNNESYEWVEWVEEGLKAGTCKLKETNQTPEIKFYNSSNTDLMISVVMPNMSKPYIKINCDWYLNRLNQPNKEMELWYQNKTRQVDIVKLCEEMIK